MKFQKQTIIALVVGALIQLGLLFTVNTSRQMVPRAYG